MQTGKPPIAFLAAGILVASLHAAAAQQPKNITINQGNCNLTIINTGKGDQKVNVETGICTDQVDPSKAIRIRYVWLDAISASLLLAGKVEGDLARSVGANPYVTKNKVYDELSDLINRFGSKLAAAGLQGSIVSTTVEGQQDSASSSTQDFAQFRKRVGNPKLYNAEEFTILPDVDAYLSIQDTPSFPSNYAMYYDGGTTSNDSDPMGMLHWVKLWRPLTRDELESYGANTQSFGRSFCSASSRSTSPTPYYRTAPKRGTSDRTGPYPPCCISRAQGGRNITCMRPEACSSAESTSASRSICLPAGCSFKSRSSTMCRAKGCSPLPR